MLSIVKLALRVATTSFDAEIQLLIDDCLSELNMLGIATPSATEEADPQIKSTVIAYCKWKFGDADEKDAWRNVYFTKLGQLQVASGYKTAPEA